MARRICDVSGTPLLELCYKDRGPTAGWHARSFKPCAAMGNGARRKTGALVTTSGSTTSGMPLPPSRP
eukprot:6413991-Prorocentrum_lima.AAC.1